MKCTSSLSNGRTIIPAALRHELQLEEGDQLLWSVRNGELVATTQRAKLRKAQSLFQASLAANSPSLADELIAERRAEAAQP